MTAPNLNIGIIIPGFSASEDDWCIPVYLDYVRVLSQQHNVRVFPIRYPYTKQPYQVYNSHVFPTGGGSYTRGLRRWKMLYRTLKAIKKQHEQHPFDVLHAIWADETGFIANWAGKRLNIPTVVTIAGGELVGFDDIAYGLQNGRISRWLVLRALMGASVIIAPSDYIKDLALDFLPPQKYAAIQTIPLGVDTDLFKPPEPDLDWRPREYLHVASLNLVKDQALLLRLVAKLPNATLDIVGDGPCRSELESLANQLGIDDRVVFHGEVPHHRLSAYYQEARYLLITSRHEAFCMAAIEALACGTGVIGSATGILPEIGLTAPVGDLDALQHAIVHRTRKRGQIQRKRNRLLAEQVYSIQQMVKNMEAVYQSLMPAGE